MGGGGGKKGPAIVVMGRALNFSQAKHATLVIVAGLIFYLRFQGSLVALEKFFFKGCRERENGLDAVLQIFFLLAETLSDPIQCFLKSHVNLPLDIFPFFRLYKESG